MNNMTNKEAIKWFNALLASDKIKPILRTVEICAIKKAIEVLQQPSLSSIIDEAAYNYRRNLQGYSNSDEVEESFKAGAQWQREQMEKKRSIEY